MLSCRLAEWGGVYSFFRLHHGHARVVTRVSFSLYGACRLLHHVFSMVHCLLDQCCSNGLLYQLVDLCRSPMMFTLFDGL